jgi:hypothetical protein
MKKLIRFGVCFACGVRFSARMYDDEGKNKAIKPSLSDATRTQRRKVLHCARLQCGKSDSEVCCQLP